MRTRIPEPWLTFLREVDRTLGQAITVHCLGGFVLSVLWALPRPTGDIDFIEAAPSGADDELLRVAGQESDLAKRHRLQFHRVTVAEYPEGYASRLSNITPGGFRRLRLHAFEVHDLVLAKLARNSPRDRSDVSFLVGKGALDRRVLESRFDTELRPYVINEARHVATLNLWLDEFFGNLAS